MEKTDGCFTLSNCDLILNVCDYEHALMECVGDFSIEMVVAISNDPGYSKNVISKNEFY